MAESLILLAIVAGAGYLAYNWKQFSVRFNKIKHVDTKPGKTIVLDDTKPDTSKEDELRDRFGDLD